MSIITLKAYEAMSLAELKAELAYWERMVEGSRLWAAPLPAMIRQWRDRCAGEIARRGAVGRAA